MKTIGVLFIFLFSACAHAEEVAAQQSDVGVSKSHFFLFKSKCEVEAEEGPETTPQSPPLNIDDPGTPGCNRWEINVVVDADVTSTERNLELPLLDLNYGIGDNIQLKYEVPFMNSQSDTETLSAVGESKVGVKYMFYEIEDDKLNIAVYPQVTLLDTNSDAVKKGLVQTGTITTLPVLMSWKVGSTSKGDVNMTANLGYNISTKSDTANFISASLGIGMPLSRRISIVSEVATEQAVAALPDSEREQITKVGVGTLATINNEFLLFGSVGHSVYSSDQLDHVYVLAGFRLLTSGIF